MNRTTLQIDFITEGETLRLETCITGYDFDTEDLNEMKLRALNLMSLAKKVINSKESKFDMNGSPLK